MSQCKSFSLSEVCQIKPPKKEAKQKLTDADLVSFVPMNNLGICAKSIELSEDKPLGKVSGSYTYFANGDVLLAKITPCFENGKLGIAQGLTNGIGFGSSEFIVFRSRGKIVPEYLFYFLSQDNFRVSGAEVMTGAVGHKRVPKEFIENQKIPLPPLPEQKRIVAILDEAFAGIDQAVANAEKNLANSRELFESYINVKLLKVASELSDKKLSDITELIVDCEHKTAPTQDTGYPSIRTPNIGKGELILGKVNRVSQTTYDLWTRRAKPIPGDLILAREAPAGNIGVIPEGEQVCLGQRTVLIRPLKNIIMPYYFACLILHPLTQKRLLAHSTGATVQHINMRDIRGLLIGKLPSIKEQLIDIQSIRRAQADFEILKNIYQQKLTALTELKQSILQKAFTGELTADTVQQQVSA